MPPVVAGIVGCEPGVDPFPWPGLDPDGGGPGYRRQHDPEENGVFLCRDEFEARFFTDLNNTDGPVDVWVVTGVEEGGIVTGGSGFCYFPAPISPAQVTLADWPQGQSVTGAVPG
jgi:hypothetical protein